MQSNYALSPQLTKHPRMTGNSPPPKFSGGLRHVLSNSTLNNIRLNRSTSNDTIAADVNADRFVRYGDPVKTDESVAQGNVTAKRVAIVKAPAPFEAVETVPGSLDPIQARARKYSELLRKWIDKRSIKGATIEQLTQEARPQAMTNGIVPPTEAEIRTVIENAGDELVQQASLRKQQIQAQLKDESFPSGLFSSPFTQISNPPPTSTAPSVPMSRSSSSSSGFTTSDSENGALRTVRRGRKRAQHPQGENSDATTSDSENFASASQQSVPSAGQASSSQPTTQRDSSPLRAFRDFSKSKLDIVGLEAVKAFNVLRNQQGKSVLSGTEQTKAMKRHRSKRTDKNTNKTAKFQQKYANARQEAISASANGQRWFDRAGKSHRPRTERIKAVQFDRKTDSVRNSPEPSY